MVELVVGVDAGATVTRCLIVTRDGVVVGRGAAAGARIRSDAGRRQDRFAGALRSALGGLDPAEVRAGVFGVARFGEFGAGGATVVRAAADMAWWAAGLAGRPRVVTDLEVAFVAGSPEPDGLLLLAGAGAAAASFVARRIARACDGYGWLLGDEGSAAWLGLRGIRAALDAHDGRGPSTRLYADLAEHIGLDSSEDLAQTLLTRLDADAPTGLRALAPLVTRAASDGDAVAAALVDAAADRLVAAVRAVAADSVTGDLVLAGALLAGGPVRDAVLARLADCTGLRIRTAGPGAAGAAALALADLGGGSLDADLHDTVLRAAAAG